MNTDESNYRFFVNTHDGNGVPTIYRARLVRVIDETGDSWSHYWDSDSMVAFYDEGSRGVRAVDGGDEEDTERAITCYRYSQSDGLSRLATRITGEEASEFIVVHLDRGTDLYALSWDGDPDHEWRDEIEALYNNEVYRVEAEEYHPGFGVGGGDWSYADLTGDEWYGEDKATAAFEAAYPLTEFPADLLVTSGD